jgi:hypothetical protein
MKIKTITKRDSRRLWTWRIDRGAETLAGGFGRTQRDAKSDANTWLKLHFPIMSAAGAPGCELDTDGDGNCPIHPSGCPK